MLRYILPANKSVCWGRFIPHYIQKVLGCEYFAAGYCCKGQNSVKRQPFHQCWSVAWYCQEHPAGYKTGRCCSQSPTRQNRCCCHPRAPASARKRYPVYRAWRCHWLSGGSGYPGRHIGSYSYRLGRTGRFSGWSNRCCRCKGRRLTNCRCHPS